MLSAEDLDAACVPLLEQLRVRRVVSAEQLADVTPTDYSDPYAWLSCYGQLRAWLSAAQPPRSDTAHDEADALVTRALREASISVPEAGDDISVYPKSFEGLLQLHVLSVQLDRLTARLSALLADGTPLDAVDTAVDIAVAISYVQQLIVWAWTAPGRGLPFAATESAPVVPAYVRAMGPADCLYVARAVTAFSEQLVALQILVDPTPSSAGDRRPSWAALFEALGAESHIDPRELAVTHSLGKVLSMTRLASDRLRPRTEDR